MNETRFNSQCNLRMDEGGDRRQVSGVAVPFDSLSEPIGQGRQAFRETFSPTAFDGEGLSRNVFSLWNHSADYPLASTGNDSLRLTARADGLHFVMTISSTAIGDQVLEDIRSGLVSGMSISFSATADDWVDIGSSDDGLPVRQVRAAILRELSPTVWPAYTETSVEADRAMRSLTAHRQVAFADVRRRRLRLLELG
jgi:HK97 family phage prohead protease